MAVFNINFFIDWSFFKKKKKIYTAKIVLKTKDNCVIEWTGNTGYGQLIFTKKENNKLEIDTEFLGIDTVLEVIKKAKA